MIRKLIRAAVFIAKGIAIIGACSCIAGIGVGAFVISLVVRF